MPSFVVRRATHVARVCSLAALCAAQGLGVATAQPAAAPAGAAPAAAASAPAATACSDFDSYVNGAWVASTELPADRARIGSFDSLRVANDKLLEAALVELAADPARQTSPGLKLLVAYYRSGMDTAGIDKRGLAAVQPWLTRIGSVQRETLPQLLGELARLQVFAPLSLGVGIDAKDATKYVLTSAQAGLGLPDRDDYLRNDDSARRLIAAYRSHARNLLQAGGGGAADDAALDTLLAFETQLAQATNSRVQRRDPVANYNPLTLTQLREQAPGLDWAAWLTAYSGKPDVLGGGSIVVAQPSFAQAVARLVQQAPLDTWRNYLRVRLLEASAEYLPKPLADSHFAYRGAAIRGLKQPPARIEQVIQQIGGQYGGAPLAESLGELFVAKAFSPLARTRAQEMLADTRSALRQRIDGLAWMSEPTKVLARAKLDAMVAKIGAPERWRRYDGLALQPDDHAGNLLRVNAWNTEQRLADLGKPVDRARWTTSPHIVNAFAAAGNQIVFPAGILQPPFFDANADDATNFGAIGMVIGHEISHHFDDRGRRFDSVGNLRDWWTAQDADAYKARADQVAQLYSSYEPLPGVRINGRLTLGENISDIAGMQLAYQGLQIALQRQRDAGTAPALIDGLTPEQRFFIANAVVWRVKARPEALLDQLRTDGHSPGRWRVLAPMSQMPAFAQAFNCKPGDAMVAANPIAVW